MLLGLQLVNLFSFLSRSNEFFPVTLGVLGLNIAAYLQPGNIAWPSISQACISFKGVCLHRQWKRLLFSPFIHASDFHLYYNMASFMWKAISLERCFGSGYFLYMISVFSVATGVLYLGINYLLAEVMNQWSYVNSCAVGFSGVIFALKVVTTHMQPGGISMIMGVFPRSNEAGLLGGADTDLGPLSQRVFCRTSCWYSGRTCICLWTSQDDNGHATDNHKWYD